MPQDDDVLLSEEELAARLQKSRYTLQRWRRQGVGPPWLRVGKSPRYRWGDVRRWLTEQGQPEGG